MSKMSELDMDRKQIERLTDVVPPPTFAKSARSGIPAHTPGPWIASTFGFQVLTGDSWNTICTLSGGAEWEDGRGKYRPEYEWQNQEANARLIAAAPDLLAAAKAVMAKLERHGPSVVPHLLDTDMNACQRLRNAIAKAEAS